ncbi:MAG TPA: hypothetical protein VHE53_03060 [Patescibacteria group bacterium]|nr:hypothetical protein [Patescibacteria group bacterium]
MEWKSYKYKNITFLVLMFLLSLVIGSFAPFHDFLIWAGYSAAFIAGVFFISTFTAPISAVTLLILAEYYPLPYLGLAAIFGAMVSDFFFFSFTKDNLGREIEPIYETLAGNHFNKVISTKHFRWMFPVIGALIILSPLPKDPGLNMIGISKLTRSQFILMSMGMNIVGIAFILLLSFVFKPTPII